jgi:hypothetical protein
MKRAILAGLLSAGIVRAQAQQARYVDVNYRLTRDAIGYPSLADTATKLREPEIFHKGTILVIRSWPSARWAEGVSAGDHYFVRASCLKLEGTPPAYLQRDGPTSDDASNSQSSDYGASPTTHTGPRGGHYYINSNGNKTYIKHK